MKRLMIIGALFMMLNNLIAQSYTGNTFTAKSWFNSPMYKLNGVNLDSTNTFKRGFFTPPQYNKLQAAYGWGNHAGLYKPIGDSILPSGYYTNYKASLVNSFWDSIPAVGVSYNYGNVGINTISPAYKLEVNGTFLAGDVTYSHIDYAPTTKRIEALASSYGAQDYLSRITVDTTLVLIQNKNTINYQADLTVQDGKISTAQQGVLNICNVTMDTIGVYLSTTDSTLWNNNYVPPIGWVKNYINGSQTVKYANTGLFLDADTVKFDGNILGEAAGLASYNLSQTLSAGFSASYDLLGRGYGKAVFFAQGKLNIHELDLSIDTTGVFLEGDVPDGTAWTDNYFITKGYADANYAGEAKLASFYTNAATSGTAETTLYSYTVPANTLSNNGDCIKAEYVLEQSASSGDISVKFGGTSRSYTFSAAIPRVVVYFIRSSSSTLRVSMVITAYANTITVFADPTGIDFTTSNNIVLTAKANNNSVTAKMGTIIKF